MPCLAILLLSQSSHESYYSFIFVGFPARTFAFFFSSFSFKPYIEVKVPQSCPTSLRPHGLYSPRNSPGQNPEVDSFSFFQGIFTAQRLNPGLPHCRQILYQLSHKGSPTGVGSLSLLQRVFPTQESNPGLLYCRWVLHQLSYQGSPIIKSFMITHNSFLSIYTNCLTCCFDILKTVKERMAYLLCSLIYLQYPAYGRQSINVW